jgi:two-component system, NtrC family, sensor histidine kinase PilS
MSPLARQLRWLIGIRLLAITSSLLPYFLLNLQPSSATPGIAPAALYTLAGLTYLASLVYIGLLRLLAGRDVVQAYVQFTGDLLLITGLVYVTGGITSPFSIFYLVVIAVASTLLRRRAGFTVATGAYVLYAGLLLGLYFGWPPHQPPAAAEPAGPFRLIYNLVVNLFAFYAVALLTSTLAYRTSRAEHELEQKREDLADLQVVHRDVIQSINSGLITTDLDGGVTSVNRAGEEILGAPAAELLGRPIQGTELLPSERWDQLIRGSGSEHRLRSDIEIDRGGKPALIGFSVSHLVDAESVQRGYIVIFQDLTRWRELQEQVRLKDRMAAVGELAAGIAHEIGNPLAAISGSVQMLAGSREAAGGGADRRLIDILLKESQRLDRTIKGFLRFARPRERATELFDIAALLAENFELLRNSEEVTAAHRLDLDLDPPSARMIADPDQISQIFWNLARNALKAMPGGGTLRIVGRLAGNRYRIRFSDTGRGMAAAERTNLFHPFKSFFDSGSGIGMAIVYRIVEEHQGEIRVDSRPAAGTSIIVELPLAGTAQPQPAGAATP